LLIITKLPLMKKLKNVHPGEVIREEFMEPMGLTAYRVAKDLHVSQTRLGEVLNGKRSVTPEMALRLATWSGATPQFWLNLQKAFDLEEALRSPVAKKIALEVNPLVYS